jgi:hypothetical protein
MACRQPEAAMLPLCRAAGSNQAAMSVTRCSWSASRPAILARDARTGDPAAQGRRDPPATATPGRAPTSGAAAPIMAKATAVWLVDNTTLSFKQIGDFCGLHELEVQGIADGEVAAGVKGFDPIVNNQLTQEEIDKAEADPATSCS